MATVQETVNQFVQQNPALAGQLRDLFVQFGVISPTTTASAPTAPAQPAQPVQPPAPPVVRVLFDEQASTAPIAEQVAQAEATVEQVDVPETPEPQDAPETIEAVAHAPVAEEDIGDVAPEDAGETPEYAPTVFDDEEITDEGEAVGETEQTTENFTVEQFTENTSPASHYIVTFEIDQRDADDITVSSYQRGKVSKKELIKLSILAHYRDLSDYDGGWWSLGPLDDFLEEYLDGNFYDQCNRFKVNGIEIRGYNADTNQFYKIQIPELSELGIDDIDAAYRQYFGVEDEEN